MEKINTEILVSSLFMIGFDRVDAFLFSYTLGQLSVDNRELQMFEFEDSKTSRVFDGYVDYDGIVFKLKDGFTLDTNVSPTENQVWPLWGALHTNRRLIDYLSRLDFRKIIIKKIESLGVERIDGFDFLFSDKEKELIYKMFGMETMSRQNDIIQSCYDDDFYGHESTGVDYIPKS